MLRGIGVVLSLGLVLAACAVPTPSDVLQSSVFARPAVVYQSGDAIGVDYYEGGIQQATNQRAAVALIEQHCQGKYRIVSRSEGRIDAVCIR